MEYIKKGAFGTCRSWSPGRRWHWKSHSSEIQSCNSWTSSV